MTTHSTLSNICQCLAVVMIYTIYLAQGHSDIQLGEAGIRTSDLPNTGQPALPPKLQLPAQQY